MVQKVVFLPDFSPKRNVSAYPHFAILKAKYLFYIIFDAKKTKRNGFLEFMASKTPRLRRTRRGDPTGVPFDYGGVKRRCYQLLPQRIERQQINIFIVSDNARGIAKYDAAQEVFARGLL